MWRLRNIPRVPNTGKPHIALNNLLLADRPQPIENLNKHLMNKLKKKINQQKTASPDVPKQPTPAVEEQNGGLTRIAMSRLQKDFAEYEPIPGCVFERADKSDFTRYKLSITPMDGYYKGGRYEFTIEAPRDYPLNPPKVLCITPVYHPNIDLEGHVCLSTLRVDKDWSPVSTLSHVIYGLLSLFLEPNPDDPLNVDAGNTMKADLSEFVRIVNKTMRGGRFFGKDFPRFNKCN